MKKQIFGGFAIVAIAVAVAFNVSITNQKQDAASFLALANVEALAQYEVIEEEPGEHEWWKPVICSEAGEPMEAGMRIYCMPDETKDTCVPFNPCV